MDDAGTRDAGQSTVDAGVMDAGITNDAGVPDAGMTMDAGMQCTPDTWTNFGQQFYAQRCNGCHAFDLAQVRSLRAQMISRIQSGDMPRGSSLTTAQKERVLEWLDCGAP